MVRKFLPRRRGLRQSNRVTHSVRHASIVEMLEPRQLLAGDPVISEFQAVNSSTLQDEDGDYSDWIEIRNPDVQDVNIGGWYLTDDAEDLTKWQIPANTTVPAGKEILVFASDKDRSDGPNGELHTNFKLSGDGEYLALVKGDGVSISQHYSPTYPPQLEDQSYGLAVGREVTSLVERDSPARVTVPTDGSLDGLWAATGFDDASWQTGTGGIGYEQLAAGFTVVEEFDAPLGDEWTVDIPEGSNSSVTVADGKMVISAPDGDDLEFGARGLAPMVFRSLPTPSTIDYELVTYVTQEEGNRGGAGLAIIDGDTGEPAIQFEYASRQLFRTFAEGDRKDSDTELRKDAYWLRLSRNGDVYQASFKYEEADEWTDMDPMVDGVDGVPFITNPMLGLYARGPTDEMVATFESFTINVPDQRPVYGPRIGLDVEAQMAGVNSSAFIRIPFTVEGDPTRFDELNLTASFDDGFTAFINGVEVTTSPGQTLLANAPFVTAWDNAATAEYGANAGIIPTRSYSIGSTLGALQTGENVLAIQGMNFAADDADFFWEGDLVAAVVLDETPQPFTMPTPGVANDLPAAPTPVITGKQGLFFGSTEVSVALVDAPPTLEIRYTTDGSPVTRESQLYQGPITINSSLMLQAVAFDTSLEPTFVPSNPASGTFIAIDPQIQDVESELPLVVLDGYGNLASAGGNSLTPMNVVMIDTSKATGTAKLDGPDSLIEYVGRGGARDRGSSTANQAKPNMAFETWGVSGTSEDDDDNVSLFGMSSASDYVLHAPFTFDAAMVRNPLAFDLSNQMGQYATDYRFVEVYIDGIRSAGDGVISENDYAGVYVFMEKIEQGDGRVDIEDTSPEDVPPDYETNPELLFEQTGGYIWKVDRADPDAGGFTAGSQSIQWVYPKSPTSRTAREDQKATSAQQTWVQDYFNAFNETLRDPDISDPEGYSKYIDVISWADTHMLNVLMMNVDALRLSAYFHKDEGEKVKYGPVWDFDRSAESNDNRDDNPLVYRSQNGDLGTDFYGNATQRWWGNLFEDPGFWQVYIDRWQAFRETVLSDENIDRMLDGYYDQLKEAAERNNARWSQSRPRTAARSQYNNNVLDGTYLGEINNIRVWLKERAAFMDAGFTEKARVLLGGEDLAGVAGVEIDPGTQLELTPAPEPLFFDTAIVDGTPGAVNARYFVPGDDSLGTDWAQPGFDDSAWQSGPLGVGFDSGDDFPALIGTTLNPNDVQPGSTTTLIRIEFNVDDLSALQDRLLTLRMKYDDGFIAYLNGTRVADKNLRAGEEIAWNSRADAQRDSEAVVFEDIDITEFAGELVQGTNYLAIRGINTRNTSNDMLILPELVSREVRYTTEPEAKVYYTTDGSDPRGPDGNPSASAILLQGGGTITVNESTRITVRSLDETPKHDESEREVKSDWSGPSVYDLTVNPTTSISISEINYNPAEPSVEEEAAGYGNDDFSFIELHNFGPLPIDLLGVKLVNGVEFDFIGTGQLAKGERAVVVANEAAFRMRYGDAPRVLGVFSGNLNNAGETVELQDATGNILFSVGYTDSDPWPATADGDGATLELIDPNTMGAARGKWYSWRASTENGGTPGTAGAGPLGVVINEVLAHTDPPVNLNDSIELHNSSTNALDISGWFLSDDSDNLFRFEIPANTVVPAGGYVVFDASQFNAAEDEEGFGLSGTGGDQVYLVRGTKQEDAPQGGVVTHFVDYVSFRETLNGEALGRVPNGSGRLAPLDRPTLGALNVDPRVGPIVITEVMYKPVASEAALAADPSLETSDLEFIEITNPTDAPVNLTDWRIRGGVDYEFADGLMLAAGQSIVVLKFNPDDPENINQVNAFRAHYGIGDDVMLVGGYAGLLNNSDERVTLLRPDPTTEATRVQEDEVLYDDLNPWPVPADRGLSLQRIPPYGHGNDPASWIAAEGTPGRIIPVVPGDMDDNGILDAEDINAMFAEMRSATPNLEKFDLTGDGAVDADDRDYLVEQLIGIPYGDANFDGYFNSSDLVAAFIVGEYEDGVALNSTWQEGDWDGDGDFTTADFVLALASGSFESAALAANTEQALVDDRFLLRAALEDSDAGAEGEQKLDGVSGIVTGSPSDASNQKRRLDAVDASFDSLFDDKPQSEVGDDDDGEAVEEIVASLDRFEI